MKLIKILSFLLLFVPFFSLSSEISNDYGDFGKSLIGKYQVTNSGAFVYSLPLKLPFDNYGYQPKLSINYNSQKIKNHLGLIGKGTSFGGISKIERCSKNEHLDGVKSPVSKSDNTALCYNNNRMVINKGNNLQVGSKYFVVGFNNIEIEFNDNGFIARNHLNGEVEYLYHETIGGDDTVYTWLISHSEDVYSREISYEYEGYIYKVSSQLTKVKYGNTEVVFDYSFRNYLLEDKVDNIYVYKLNEQIEKYNIEYHDNPRSQDYLLKSIEKCVVGFSCYNKIEFFYDSQSSEFVIRTNNFHEVRYKFEYYFKKTKNERELINDDYNYLVVGGGEYVFPKIRSVSFITRVYEVYNGEIRRDRKYKYGGLYKVEGYNSKLQFMFNYVIEGSLVKKKEYAVVYPIDSKLIRESTFGSNIENKFTDRRLIYKNYIENNQIVPRLKSIGIKSVDSFVNIDYLYENGLLTWKSIKNKRRGYPSLEHVNTFSYEYDSGYKIVNEIEEVFNENSYYKFNTHFEYDANLARTRKTITNNDGSTKTHEIKYNKDGQVEHSLEKFDDKLPDYAVVNYEQNKNYKTSYTYENGFVSSIKNELGHIITYEFNDYCAMPSKVEDENGTYKEIVYDPFCRVIKEKLNGIDTINYQYNSGSYNSSNNVAHHIAKSGKGIPTSYYSYNGFDELISSYDVVNSDKLYYSKNIDYSYDEMGRVIKISLPYETGQNKYYINKSYDIRGRVSVLDTPLGETIYRYSSNRLIEVESKGSQTEYILDSFSRPIEIRNKGSLLKFKYDAIGNVTNREINGVDSIVSYDAWGNTKETIDPSFGKVLTYINAFGNLVWEKSANGHVKEIKYDSLGRVVNEGYKDDNGEILKENTIQWDLSNNGVGKVSKVSNGSSDSIFEYDENGYLSSVKDNIDGKVFYNKFSNDVYGNVVSEVRPNGLELRYFRYGGLLESIYRVDQFNERRDDVVNEAKKIYRDSLKYYYAKKEEQSESIALLNEIIGDLKEIKDYYDKNKTNRKGLWINNKIITVEDKINEAKIIYKNLKKMRFELWRGNQERLKHLTMVISGEYEVIRLSGDVKFNKFYDKNFKHIHSRKREQIWKAMKYNANGIVDEYISGNIYHTSDKYSPVLGGFIETRTLNKYEVRNVKYEYDRDYNLVEINDFVNNINQAFDYDRKDRLVSYSLNSNLVSSYNYDDFGNIYNDDDPIYNNGDPYQLTSYNGSDINHDSNGNILEAKGVNFDWDPIGKPSKIYNNSDTVILEYSALGTLIVERVNNDKKISTEHGYWVNIEGSGNREERNYIFANGKVIAYVSKGENSDSVTNYVFNNNLGSLDTVINDLGHVVNKSYYDPFGKRHDFFGLNNSNIGYTGHRELDKFELIYMGGRTYDPGTSRFISPDPIITFPFNSENYNRYSYVMNSPFKYIDPTGHEPVYTFEEVIVTASRYEPIVKFGMLSPSLGNDAFYSMRGWSKAGSSSYIQFLREDIERNYDVRYNNNGQFDHVVSNASSYAGTHVWGTDNSFALSFAHNNADATYLLAIIPFTRGVKYLASTRFGVYVTKNTGAVKQGIYEFMDAAGKKYVGQSVNIPNRLKQHLKAGKLEPNQSVKTTEVLGGKTAREIAEHKRIQEITGGVPARFSDKVSNKVDPIGLNRRHLLD